MNEIREYRFGQLSADADGNLDAYTDRPINGTVKKITFENATFDAAGSILVQVSGLPTETILNFIPYVGDSVVYLASYGTDGENTTGSPYVFTTSVVNSPLRLIGSGLGALTSGTGITVYYQ